MTKRTLFLIVLVLELVMIFGLFVPHELIRMRGTEITLETMPVDPWSFLRGQYVVLDYDLGLDEPEIMYDDTSYTVYAILEKQGDVYKAVEWKKQDELPELKPGQQCLVGSLNWGGVIFSDIAQYFVQEGEGQDLQNAQNAHRLLVNAAVTPECRALLLGVTVGAEVSDEERQRIWEEEFPTIPTDDIMESEF